MEGVSRFWAAQVVARDGPPDMSAGPVTGDRHWETLNLTDPDEYANFKNDGAVTNAGLITVLFDTLEAAKILGRSFKSINARNWSSIALNTTLLRARDSSIVLEYDGFNATTEVKQADVPLLVYPLLFNERFPEMQPKPRADVDFYSGATSPNGPGMTYSIYGIASTQLDGTEAESTPPNCVGYTRLLQSGNPYEREFSQFSEQVDDYYLSNGGTNPAYTFLTGHGGYLQSYTHGLLGYRTTNDSDHTLYIDPNLPPQLARHGGITIKGVRHGRSSVDITIQEQHTTVTLVKGKKSIKVRSGPSGKKQTIRLGQSVHVETRTLAQMEKVGPKQSKNYALCGTISDAADAPLANASSTIHSGTNIAQGANDGSNATYFQASRADIPTSLIVDLREKRRLHQMHLNFGSLPPKILSVSILQSNGSSTDQHNHKVIVDRIPINITQPYNASTALLVQLPVNFNTTDVDLTQSGQIESARFVNITLEGVATPQDLGYGATLLEFILN